MNDPHLPEPGLIILFGSGETSPAGRKIFEEAFHSLPKSPRIALLETPAGFELNSHQVIQRVADFLCHRLQNFTPQVEIIPARKRGTIFSPDEPEIVAPLLRADMIFMGPGSPTYATRQLQDSLAWHYLVARHRFGTALALASAATIAFSAYALPVYEIYKVGEDIHWNQGLDFFRLYGLEIVFVPHWNNKEGGANLDSSRCFMGEERFARLVEMLPDTINIIGLDEKTALILQPSSGDCKVLGAGKVTLIHAGHKHPNGNNLIAPCGNPEINPCMDHHLEKVINKRDGHIHVYSSGQVFTLSDLGPFHPYEPEVSLPPGIWENVRQAIDGLRIQDAPLPPQVVLQLIKERDEARAIKDWIVADEYRKQIELLGWEIIDTKNGPVSRKLHGSSRN